MLRFEAREEGSKMLLFDVITQVLGGVAAVCILDIARYRTVVTTR